MILIPNLLTAEEIAAGVIAIECVFQHTWEKYYPVGKGNYPYECIRKDESPDAMVYHNRTPTGSTCWTTLAEYVEVMPSYYVQEYLAACRNNRGEGYERAERN